MKLFHSLALLLAAPLLLLPLRAHAEGGEAEGPMAQPGAEAHGHEGEEHDCCEEQGGHHGGHHGHHGLRAELEVDDHFGVTGLPPTADAAQVDALVHSWMVEAKVAIAHHLDIKVFVPFTYASRREEGDVTSHFVFGNLGLAVEKVVPIDHHNRVGFELIGTAPTAGGDAFSTDAGARTKAEIGELSGRIRAFEEDEFYTAKRASIVPLVKYMYERRGWDFSAYVKVPIAIRAGGEDPPAESNVTIRGVSVETVAALQLLYAWGHMEGEHGTGVALGARAIGVFFLSDPVDAPNVDLAKQQFTIESVLRLHVSRISGQFGVLFPIDSRLSEPTPHPHAFRIALGTEF